MSAACPLSRERMAALIESEILVEKRNRQHCRFQIGRSRIRLAGLRKLKAQVEAGTEDPSLFYKQAEGAVERFDAAIAFRRGVSKLAEEIGEPPLEVKP